MAFAQVEAVNGGTNGAGTDHTVDLPADIGAGELLLVIFGNTAGAPTASFPEGWTTLPSGDSANVRMTIGYRVADGEEGASITVTTSGAAISGYTSFRISAYYGTLEIGTGTKTSSTSPNPPSLTPSWLTKDTLWLAACVYADNAALNAYPTNYTDGRNDWDVGINCAVGSATRELNAASEDPGVFTLASSTYWVAQTIAIQPLQPVPDPPTDVSATDGAHTDKVVITWTPDADAIDYQVYRDGVGLGWLGDVATYNDEAADAPTITPGTAIASDGEYSAHVALSLTGNSTNNGTTHTYKVRGRNANLVESGDSATDTGYIGVGAFTYQWQRSFDDADELYTAIVGATSSTHNDIDAPERGWGRYYQCVLNAEGAAQQISASNRGYRLAPVVPLEGTTRIDAKDYMAQLGDETVFEYTATEKAANTIVDELLALQLNTPAITAGTIEYTNTLSIDVTLDSILGVLMRLREILGGFISVNQSRELNWVEDIGSDTGQQIRYGKNMAGIKRISDWSKFANRLYVYGDGAGEERVVLSGRICQSELVPGTDIAEKRIIAEAWKFTLAPSSWMVGCWDGTGGSVENKIGAGGRFLNVPIAQGKTINHAYLIFPDSAYSNTIVNSKIKGEDVDDAATFSNLTDYDARDRTTANVSWNAIPSWASGGERWSPDIKTVIQEIVDRGGWVSGNAMVIFWEDHDGASNQKSYNIREGSLPPVLYIEYASSAEDYVEDIISQAKYGGVYTRTLINKAIQDSATLNEWAALKLMEMKDPYISYEVDMVNLEAAGISFDALTLGNTFRVIDEDLDINVATQLVKITRDLVNPYNVKVQLSNKVRDAIDQLGRDFRWENENY